jgi:hypothetical protein
MKSPIYFFFLTRGLHFILIYIEWNLITKTFFMKKFFSLFLALSVLVSSFAASTPSIVPVKKAADVLIPIGAGQQISLLDLSQISVKDFEKLSGKKMKLADKVGFKIAQKELRNSINNDGTINSKKLNKFVTKAEGSGFHLGGFALGFLLGLIGVLVAYLINDDLKHQRVKWAWLGLLAAFVISLIFILAVI